MESKRKRKKIVLTSKRESMRLRLKLTIVRNTVESLLNFAMTDLTN